MWPVIISKYHSTDSYVCSICGKWQYVYGYKDSNAKFIKTHTQKCAYMFPFTKYDPY